MTKDTYRSQFRLPWPLYEQLKAASEESGRSLNAELVARLQESFEPPSPDSLSFDEELKERLIKEFVEQMREELPWRQEWHNKKEGGAEKKRSNKG